MAAAYGAMRLHASGLEVQVDLQQRPLHLALHLGADPIPAEPQRISETVYLLPLIPLPLSLSGPSLPDCMQVCLPTNQPNSPNPSLFQPTAYSGCPKPKLCL